MTETKTQTRLATTAIAAALAISATPLLAQDAPAPDTPVESPAPAAADPLGPEPATDSIVPVTVAPEVTQTTSEAAPASATKAKPARRAATTSTRPAARPAQAPPQSAVTPAPAVAVAEPVQAPPGAEATPIEAAAPVIVEPAATRQAQMNVILAIAGAALLGLIALVAAIVALRRRKRRREELLDEQVYETEAVVAEPEPEPAMAAEPKPATMRTEPSFVVAATPVAAPAVVAEASDEVEGPVTELPEGFDLSRFGHHVQQAYKGPTEENPSLSLKHRLRRASGMDQMERTMDAEIEAATGESVLDEVDATPHAEAPAAKPAVADAAPGNFLLSTPGKEPVEELARTH